MEVSGVISSGSGNFSFLIYAKSANEPSKAFFNSFSSGSFLFDSFLKFLSLALRYTSVPYVVYFFIKALSILIGIFKSLV